LKEETKKKKQYLKRYRNYLVRIERLEEKLSNIDDQLLGMKSVTINDMPRGGIPLTKDDLLSKKEETQERIQKLVDISRDVKNQIYDCIETLDDYRFAEVLEHYFVDGYTFEAIAEIKCYSLRHVGYLYAKGLEKVVINERITS
jgi:DNA-directed RNA polymerase specialized sigma24 family protein